MTRLTVLISAIPELALEDEAMENGISLEGLEVLEEMESGDAEVEPHPQSTS